MPTIGFVLIKSSSGKERDVYNRLAKLKEIKEVHTLLGEYDFIAKIEGPDMDAISKIVINKIRTIPAVTHTETLTTGPKF